MEYRTLPKSGDRISTVALGGTHMADLTPEEAAGLVSHAVANGINFVDFATTSPKSFALFGPEIKRHRLMFSLHLGLTFTDDGVYERSRDLEKVKNNFEAQLAQTGRDYADVGFIIYADDLPDYEKVFSSGVFDYALQLKKSGRIRNLGFSSHNPDIARRYIESGEFDVCLFSINPAYDLDPVKYNPLEQDLSAMNAISVAQERVKLYRLAEKHRVGLMVMKPFAGGRLLDPKMTPFERPLTVPQCLQYCFDRPAVVSCMIGLRSSAELDGVLAYYDSSPEERDYAFIADLQYSDMLGKCVYCGHCQPCPSNIDIALVNKFADLYAVGDELAREHYQALEHKASDCVECGSCEERCPFKVGVIERMRQTADVFAESL